MSIAKEVGKVLFERAIPDALKSFTPRSMLDSYTSCNNKKMTKYGPRLYSFIKFGRTIDSIMIDYGCIVHVYVVDVAVDIRNDRYSSFLVVKYNNDSESRLWFIDIAADNGYIDLATEHNVNNVATEYIPQKYLKYLYQDISFIDVHVLEYHRTYLGRLRDMLEAFERSIDHEISAT